MRSSTMRTLIGVTAVAAALTLTACGHSDSTGAQSGGTKVVATTYKDWVPAAFVDEKGNYTGYFYDVEKNATDAAGWQVDFQAPPFEAVIPGLQSGKYDLGGGVDVTAERLKVIDIVSVISVGYTFLTKGANPDVANTEDALCGVRVGAVAAQSTLTTLDQISDACVAAGKPKVAVSTFPDDSAGLLALQAGNIDVRTINTAEGSYYITHHPEFKITGPTINKVDAGVAFKKGDPRAQAFADAVNKTIADGSYTKVLQKYGAEQTAITKSVVNPKPAL